MVAVETGGAEATGTEAEGAEAEGAEAEGAEAGGAEAEGAEAEGAEAEGAEAEGAEAGGALVMEGALPLSWGACAHHSLAHASAILSASPVASCDGASAKRCTAPGSLFIFTHLTARVHPPAPEV